MKKKHLIILIVVLIIVILGFNIHRNINSNLLQMATDECVGEYGYSGAMPTTTGYICFNLNEWCDLKEDKKHACKKIPEEQ